jgi:hypothetical protein
MFAPYESLLSLFPMSTLMFAPCEPLLCLPLGVTVMFAPYESLLSLFPMITIMFAPMCHSCVCSL